MQMSCKFFKVEIKHDSDHVVIFRRGDIIRLNARHEKKTILKSVPKQGELEFSNIEHAGL